MGIQVSNWNEDRTQQLDYLKTLQRLESEVAMNLDIIERENLVIADVLKIVHAGFDALLSCTDGSDAVAKTNAAIAQLRGTRGIYLQFPVLTELNTNSNLLAKQSDQERAHFADLLFTLSLAKEISAKYEPDFYSQRVATATTLAIQPAKKLEGVFFGQPYEVLRYSLELDVAMPTACKDKELLKHFQKWEKWQSDVTVFHGLLRQKYLETRQLLEAKIEVKTKIEAKTQ